MSPIILVNFWSYIISKSVSNVSNTIYNFCSEDWNSYNEISFPYLKFVMFLYFQVYIVGGSNSAQYPNDGIEVFN
jgi:hypothetical protein